MKYILIFVCFWGGLCKGQIIGNSPYDTNIFHMQTRQLNQFIDRFNNQDPDFAFPDQIVEGINLTKKMNILHITNQEDSAFFNDSLTTVFINTMANASNEFKLSYFDSDWYAVAECKVTCLGKEGVILLTLKPTGSPDKGYRWSIIGVNPFLSFKSSEDTIIDNLLSPYNNEVNFVDLHHFFNKAEDQEDYFLENFEPDYLSLLMYAIKNDDIAFNGVNSISYHFLQLENWYFTINNYARPGNQNSGWLISSVNQINSNQKDYILKNTLFISN